MCLAQWTVCSVCIGPEVKSPALRNKVKEVIDSPKTSVIQPTGVRAPVGGTVVYHQTCAGLPLGPKLPLRLWVELLTEAAQGCHVWVRASIPFSPSTPKCPLYLK